MTNEATKLFKLGKNIQALRRFNKLSQNVLAEKLDISREHLAKIETGKRGVSLGLIFKIAEALNVKESELFNFD